MTGELTVRTLPAGGPVRDSVRELIGNPRGMRRLVLFIHGYQNDHPKACESYVKMLDSLSELGVNPEFLDATFLFYWPGDRKNKLLSVASYPTQIARAQESAIRLAKYLVEIQRANALPIELSMVSHSLGGRIVLEVMKELDRLRRDGTRVPTVELIGMMAAAVPVQHADHGGALTVRARTSEMILYSRKDRALGHVFRAGQTAAGDGWYPRAVGRTGQPSSRWGHKALQTRYSHGQYWGGTQSSVHIGGLFGSTEPAPPRANVLAESPERASFVADSHQLPASRVGSICHRAGVRLYSW